MDELVLRDAQPDDQIALRDVTIAAYQEYAEVMPPLAWQRYRENILETLADVSPAEQIVAVRGGEILGTVLLYPAGTAIGVAEDSQITWQFPEVRLLAVTPAARGQGIGLALMRECITRARNAGVTALSLHTTDLMQSAMKMYERMGFVRTPETDFHPTPTFTVKGYRYALT